MKINLKNVTLVMFAIGGVVVVTASAINSSKSSKSTSGANVSDSSMMSMHPDAGSCEMCSSGSLSTCTDGSCPQNESMTNMALEKSMSMGGTMSISDTKAAMSGQMMHEVNKANAMSPSMSDKSMTPNMGSPKSPDAEQMTLVNPKM